MSTFAGPILTLPGVSVDNFTWINLNSGCFFLSHCHKDHMNGLLARYFTSLLKLNKNYVLYGSPMTKLILSTFSELAECQNQIQELKYGLNIVKVPVCGRNLREYDLTVSCIPAGHCPGSVMFLFQTPLTTALYTGDFRIAVGDVAKFKQFHNQGQIIQINDLYLDTTFLNENYYEFLSRERSIQIIIEKIREWLDENPNHHVRFEMTAFYGGESILEKVANEFKCLVHVLLEVYNMYLAVPEMTKIFTINCQETRIHSQNRSTIPNCLENVSSNDILVIKPKIATFQCKKGENPVEFILAGNYLEVNYSSHSSYSEIFDFIQYLKPLKIHACTDTFHLTDQEQKDVLNKLQTSCTEISINSIQTKKERKIITKKIAPKLIIQSSRHSITDTDLD